MVGRGFLVPEILVRIQVRQPLSATDRDGLTIKGKMKENKTLEAYLNQGYWVFNAKTGQDAISLLRSDNFAPEVELDSDTTNKIAIVFLNHPDKESPPPVVTEKEEEI